MRVLVLSTWFPYPLDRGSKIRAYHLLKALADRHETVLISFEDMPIEAAWLKHVGRLCSRVEVIERHPFYERTARRRLGMLSPRPRAVVASYSPEMEERVRKITKEWRPDRILALTFMTAPYALERTCADCIRILDVDNVMTRFLREIYERAQGLAHRARKWVAWYKFRRYEAWLVRNFDMSLTVTEQDRQVLLGLLKGRPAAVGVVANGVDTTYRRPGIERLERDTLVFNGALTYWANYEAMEYFLSKVFPSVVAEVPDVRMLITGETEGVLLDRLCTSGRVSFTGWLDDVRPAVSSSWACVVPVLSGGGTRLKILEAMALGTPVVTTSKGAEGLEVRDGEHLLIGDTPDRFAEQTVRLLRDPGLRERLASSGRQLVVDKYEWSAIESRVRELVEHCERKVGERRRWIGITGLQTGRIV